MDERINAVLDGAELSPDDRELWMTRLEATGDRAQAVFTDLFAGDPDLLRFFTRNLRARIDAGDDPMKLKAVLEEERERLRTALTSVAGQ